MKNITHAELAIILRDNQACDPAMEWFNYHKSWSLAELWKNCTRADWMIWLLFVIGENPRIADEMAGCIPWNTSYYARMTLYAKYADILRKQYIVEIK